jgi:bla regulator protein BlaR1
MNVTRLGWTLVHFLWQGNLIAMLYAAVRHFVCRADGRYLLACAALASMMAAPLVTWYSMGLSDATPSVAVDQTAKAQGAIATATALPVAVQALVPATQKAQWLQWAVAI